MNQLLQKFTIQGDTRVLGLLGSGIGHSLSPLIHNYSAKKLGLNCVYLPFDSQAKIFPERSFFQTMWDIGAVGFNITVPFKQVAANMFAGSGLRSVNTLYRGEGGWLSNSTDAEGFLMGLAQQNLALPQFQSIILLGNGGACLALYEHFLKISDLPLIVLRRTADRDLSWSKPATRVRFDDLSEGVLQQVCQKYPRSLIIQTTSAPLHGDRLEYLVPGLKPFAGAFVDLVYGKTSALLEVAGARGLPTQDGLSMLIGQALLGQQLWWGKSASFSDVEWVLRDYLQRSPGTKEP